MKYGILKLVAVLNSIMGLALSGRFSGRSVAFSGRAVARLGASSSLPDPSGHPSAFFDNEVLIGLFVLDRVNCTRWPADRDRVHVRGFTQTEVHSRIAGGKVAAVGAHLVSLNHSAGCQLDAGAETIAVRASADGLDADPVSLP